MDIAIIGIGIIDSIGSSPDECWNNMTNGVVGMSPSTLSPKEQFPILKVNNVHMVDLDKADVSQFFSPKDKAVMGRGLVLALHSAIQCINDANIASKDVAVVAGVNGNFNTIEVWTNLENNKRTSPRMMHFAMRDSITATVTKLYGYTGVTSTVSNMCTSSINALDYAVRTINEHDNEYALVTGADSFVSALDIYVMQSMQATSTDEHPLSRPFDVSRNGITLGEGACSFMLTSLENAKRNNHKVYGVIKGIGHGTEAIHETNMSTDGIGSRNAINMALRKAKLINNDIGYVNCHATGTPQGDIVEYDIVGSMFPGITVGANKANIGHNMGACGMLELFYTVKALSEQIAPPIANLTNPIGNNIHMPVVKTSINAQYAIKNSFGFGGKSCCVVVERGLV